LVPQNPESMPQDPLTYTKLGIPDSTPPESALVLEISQISALSVVNYEQRLWDATYGQFVPKFR
jgi:hypothetical protein